MTRGQLIEDNEEKLKIPKAAKMSKTLIWVGGVLGTLLGLAIAVSLVGYALARPD